MRTALVALVAGAFACAPKGPDTPGTLDDDLDHASGSKHLSERQDMPAPQSLADGSTATRAIAPPAPGTRSGTIDRAHLVAILDKGPADFLHQFEVTARMDGERFVGWELVQLLDAHGALDGLDVAPGDVLIDVNGKAVDRPDRLFELWDSLRTANEVVAEVWRGRDKVELRFAIEPRL